MNNLKLIKLLFISVGIGTLAACVSAPPAPQATAAPQSSLPDWVTSPLVEGGIADTQCVPAKTSNGRNAGMNILKNKATSLARAEIAKQIDIKVKAMDKTFDVLKETVEGAVQMSSFQSVSKQVTQQNLSGSRAIKVDYVTLPGDQQSLCVMVAMDPDVTKTVFKDLIKNTGTNLPPNSEAAMYQDFLEARAVEEMEAGLRN